MAYGSPLTSTVPTPGVTAGPLYAEDVNDFLEELQDIVEARVTPAGMDISSDLSFLSGGTNYRAKDLKAASYENQASALSAATYPTSLYFSGIDGNLYANDASGRQVQITAAGAVNASTTGGITGSGYGASGVEVNWDSGSSAYLMKAGSAADDYASVICQSLLLQDGSGNSAEIVTPSLSADKTWTLPSAYPAGNGYMVAMSTAGVLSTTTTPTFGTVTAGTVTSTGHVVVSGTNLYKHGVRYRVISPHTAGLSSFNRNGAKISAASGSATAYVPLNFDEGQHVSDVSVYWDPAGTGSKVMSIVSIDEAGTEVTVATRTFTSSSKSDYTITGSDFTVASEKSYYLLISAGDTGDDIHLIRVQYDQP